MSTSHTGLRDLCTDFSYSNSVALLERKEKTVWPKRDSKHYGADGWAIWIAGKTYLSIVENHYRDEILN